MSLPVDIRATRVPRPSGAVVAGLAALAVAAAGGWWLGGVSRTEAPAVAPASVAVVGDLRLTLDPEWATADAAPRVAGAQAFAPAPGLSARALLVSGSPVDATLVPAALRAELPENLPAPRKTELGALPAWSYGPVHAGGRVIEVTVAPTTGGVLAVACAAPPASWNAALDCEAGVRSITSAGSEALTPSTDLAFRQAAGPVLRELDGRRVAGRRALGERLSAATALAKAHRAAAAELEPFVAPGAPADAIAALREAARGYDTLASDPPRRRFIAARVTIARADAALAAALR
jgi:hypothetical protein